jgi:hypothetical protein
MANKVTELDFDALGTFIRLLFPDYKIVNNNEGLRNSEGFAGPIPGSDCPGG